MLNWLKSLPLIVKVILVVVVLVLGFLVFDKGALYWAHFKGWKSDKEYAATIQKSDDLSKQSAELKAQADQLEKLAAAKDQQIQELTDQANKYGQQAKASADAINQSYAQLEQDKQSIQNASDDELRYRICKDRADLGFPNVGQCKGWKP